MLKSLSQGMQQVLVTSSSSAVVSMACDASSPSVRPERLTLSERMSTSGASQDELSSPESLAQEPCDAASSKDEAEFDSAVVEIRSADRAAGEAEVVEINASGDKHGNLCRPPSSWGQVSTARRASAEVAATMQPFDHPLPGARCQLHVADSQKLSVGSVPIDRSSQTGSRDSASHCRTPTMPTPPPRSYSRSSWASEADAAWFARSPAGLCTNHAARMKAAESCDDNPPAQEASYGALLARLPPCIAKEAPTPARRRSTNSLR